MWGWARKLAELGYANVEFVLGSASDLSYESCFDYVFSTNVFHSPYHSTLPVLSTNVHHLMPDDAEPCVVFDSRPTRR